MPPRFNKRFPPSVSPILAGLVGSAMALVLISNPVTAQQAGAEETAEGHVAEAEEAKPEKKRKRKMRRKEVRELTEALPAPYRQWLHEVHWLISDEERQAFLEIEKDYQRDAFIERFWRIRDPFPESPRNEFKIQWYERLQFIKQEFGEEQNDDRARMMLLNGPPDGRIEFKCTQVVVPLDIWIYRRSERVGHEFFLIFHRKWGAQRYYLWRPSDGVRDLIATGADASSASGANIQTFFQDIYSCKDGDVVAGILSRALHPSYRMDYEMTLARTERPSETPDGEWLETFASYTTEIPEDANTFDAEVSLEYPDRYQSRTVMRGVLSVDKEQIGTVQLADHTGYNFFLTGEVLDPTPAEGDTPKLFEQFRYKYDLSANEVQGVKIPLVFERRLRPGSYRLVLRLEDLNGKSFFRYEDAIEVPLIDVADRRVPEDPETRRLLEEANIVIGSDIATIKLLEPHGTMQVGMVRFDTLATGVGIEEVKFWLNDQVVLQKRRPPYSVELNLGSVPRTHEVRVSAHDADGVELTSDQMTINAGEHQFEVALIEPRSGVDYASSVDAEASVLTPEGRPVERVEFFHNEDLVATLYQEPWVARIDLPNPGELAYIRAVAYLPDGNATDDMEYINAPDYLENLDIEFVEMYTSALDKNGRPIQGLAASNFSVTEDGVAQTIARFEKVDNLPIHAEVVIDVSASMKDNVQEVQQAALQFFESAITPKDRAALVTFNDHPNLMVKMTNEVDELAGGLAGLKAERGTALWDAMVFSLYYMNGLKGQKAMLLLSDGKDEVSRFSFDQTLEYARRAGVSIYAIGLNITGKESGIAKRNLTRLADETGGRSFFIKGVDELDAIYAAIEQELRSRYLIAYQSTNSDPRSGFRSVEVRVDAPGAKAKTIRGYYP